MELCRAPLDFLGINYYRRQLISAIPPGAGEDATGVHNFDAHEGPLTDFAWEVWPDGFHDLLFRISREYKGTPLEITENGCSYLDGPGERGRIPDERRIQFLRGYLQALGGAMLHGANVGAYHHWSLLDNFEWAEATPSVSASRTSTSGRKSAPSRTPATGTPSSLPPALSRNRAPTIRDRAIITIKKRHRE
jgi:beta-glucosidase/6-phospho-beta-glucosidase/beta-galactosidase